MLTNPLISAIALVVFAFPAIAADTIPSYPNISGEIAFELQNDAAYNSDDVTLESNNLTAKIVPVTSVTFTPEFSLNTELTFE